MSNKTIMPDPFDQSITDLAPETEPSERLEMLNAFANENYSVKNIQLKTELNINQITIYSKALLFGKRYKNTVIPELVNNIMKLSVSKNRAGRKEYTSIAQSMLAGIPQVEPQRSTVSERLFGK
jgi:hypothetical protein